LATAHGQLLSVVVIQLATLLLLAVVVVVVQLGAVAVPGEY
jgi:hypothetical protein